MSLSNLLVPNNNINIYTHSITTEEFSVDDLIINKDGALIFENSDNYTTSITAQATAANRNIIIPESTFGGINYFVVSGPDSYINGEKSFTTTANFQAVTNQITFSSPFTTILNVTPPTFPTVTRTVNITDPGSNCNILLSAGNQSMSGIQTITNTTDSTSISTGSLIVNGGAAINKNIYVGTTSASDGIVLNNSTASYSPAVLNYYETLNVATTFECRGGTSSPVNVTYIRIGNLVKCTISAISLITIADVPANILYSTGGIPVRFRPSLTRIEVGYFTNFDGTAGVNSSGPLHVLANGDIQIYRSALLPDWNTNTTVQLVYGASFCYNI